MPCSEWHKNCKINKEEKKNGTERIDEMALRRAFGTDVSFWQGNVDFRKMKKAGASFTFIKASQNVWHDKKWVSSFISIIKS